MFQYSVTLQSEEVVADEHKANPKQSSTVISYNKHHETCLSWNQSQLVLPIPLHVTPAFSTQLGNQNHTVFKNGDKKIK